MSLLRSAASVGSMTLVSRILGFVRDMMIAAALGAGPAADAFVAAFQFPNLFRRLFAEGAFNAAFVPLFAKRYEVDGKDAAQRFAEEVASIMATVLLALMALAIALMPWLVYVFVPGFSGDLARSVMGVFADLPGTGDIALAIGRGKLMLTVEFARILFPYLLFVSLLALYAGILNSIGRFALAAFAPVLLNACAIMALVVAPDSEVGAGRALAWGVAVSGVLQFLLVVWGCRRAGIRLHLRWPSLTPGVRRFLALGVPGVIAGGVTQVNLLAGGAIASFQEGARAWLYYADRVYQLPLGLVGVAIGVVLLPNLARKLRAGEDRAALAVQNRAFELAMLLTVPAAVALVVAAEPIVVTLFARGAFDATDATATAVALAVYAVGLPAFVMIKIFSPAFFAREDTRTPMRFAGASVAVNIALGLALFPVLGHVGIAAATTCAGWTNALALVRRLSVTGAFVPDASLRHRAPRIVLAALAMGIAVLGLRWLGVEPMGATWHKIAALAALVVLGAIAFAACALALKAVDLGELKRAFVRRAPA